LLLGCILLACFIEISTASHVGHDSSKGGTADYTHYPQGGGMRVTATFGSDGRLWRIVPEKKFIYVDYSIDLGKKLLQMLYRSGVSVLKNCGRYRWIC